jgi:acetate---CoA ligase (ADP-forming)
MQWRLVERRSAVPCGNSWLVGSTTPEPFSLIAKQSLFLSGGGMVFWTESQMASIHRMLNPRSIAIVGATPRMQYGGRFLAAALRAKDRLRVYAVNPRYDEIMGVMSYPRVTDLPEAPDVVGIVVPHDQVLDVLKESHHKGAGSAIVISAGFAERGVDDRRDLQRELGAFARASGLRISGPNCLGVANVKRDIWATSSSRGASGLSGPIGLVCQSGATAFGPFLVRAVEKGIGFSYIISTGNEADLDFADFARYLLDDPETRVIAGFVEGFKQAEKFLEVAKLAAERGKPIVLIKIGRSELGAKAARSHTAALTGMDARYDAIFAQYGVIRVQDYDELLEVSQLLAHCPKPSVPGIAVVSHSGGISSLTADMCGQAGIDLPLLGEAARAGINGILKGFGSAANPADVTGFANSDSFPQIMEHMINDPEIGTLVVASAGEETQARQVISQRDRADKGVVFLWTGSRDAKAGLAQLKSAGIPIFYTPDKLARGLKSHLAYHTWRERRLRDGFATAPSRTPLQESAMAQALGLGRLTLSESESKQLLAAWGVPSARELRATSAEAAVAAARQLGVPVALKVDSPDIPHKTEAGAIRLNLDDAARVRAAYAEVMAGAKANAPQARITGVSVQEMVGQGVEVIIGVSFDPQLGPVLLFGSGGVMVEVYNDVALRRCPITHPEAQAMITEVKGARLLQGFRGGPKADVEALADSLVRVSHLAMHLQGRLAELDINPLMVLPAGQGVRALDALIVFRDT